MTSWWRDKEIKGNEILTVVPTPAFLYDAILDAWVLLSAILVNISNNPKYHKNRINPTSVYTHSNLTF